MAAPPDNRSSAQIFAEDFDALFGDDPAPRQVTPAEEQAAALALGWLRKDGDRYVITEAGLRAQESGERYLLQEDGAPLRIRGT